MKIKKVVAPPENLPVEKLPVPKLRFAFVTALAFVLLIGGVAFGKESFKNVYKDISPLVQNFSEGFDIGMAKESDDFFQKLSFTFAGINASSVIENLKLEAKILSEKSFSMFQL